MKRSASLTWKVVKLGDIVSFKTGKVDSNAATVNGIYPFFTCAQETYRTDTCAFDCECVLLAGNNAAGVYPLKYFNGKFDAYQRTYIIRSLDRLQLANRFLYFAMRPRLEHLKSISTGAATKFLTLGLLKGLDIELPPLETQHKIASILSTYDDLIENNTRRIKILEEMAQTIYREWFVNFRFPGHEKVKMVDSPLGKIPEGWEMSKFTDVADVLSGGTPKTKLEEYWNGNIPFFAPKDAPAQFYVTRTEKKITNAGLEKCSSKLYPKETVFITARGTVGKVVMPAIDMAMNQSCYALVGKEGISQPYLFLLTLQCVDYLKKNTGGATFDTIIVDTFRRLDVMRPPNKLIEQITEKIRPILSLCLNLIMKNQNLRQTRDLLLPKLISGAIDVSKMEIDVKETAA